MRYKLRVRILKTGKVVSDEVEDEAHVGDLLSEYENNCGPCELVSCVDTWEKKQTTSVRKAKHFVSKLLLPAIVRW